MVGRYGLDYAVHIVTSHFGDLVAKVCSCLLHRGSLSLQELIRFTEFSPSTVKNCLLVLIQHNCVQAFSVPRPGSGGTVRAVTLYMSLFDNIIHRSRFSKFVAVVSEDDELIDEGSVDAASTSKRPSSLKPVSGVKKPNFATGTKKTNLGVNLIDGLLQHGRLTFEQLFVREASKQGNAIARDELRVQFNRLVRAQYVERCPRPEPFLSDADDKPASSRRRGAKTFEETPTIEQQALTASALSVAVRFSPLTDIGADTRADVKIKRPNLDLLVGDKVINVPECFRLFATVVSTTKHEGSYNAEGRFLSSALWRKVMVRSPSREDLSTIINAWYPSLKTFSMRLVETFEHVNSLAYFHMSGFSRFSLRDLLKWAKRVSGLDLDLSRPELTAVSSEKIYQEAVDVFAASTSSLDKRFATMSDEVAKMCGVVSPAPNKPLIQNLKSDIRVGRITLQRTHAEVFLDKRPFVGIRSALVALERVACSN